MLLYDLSVVAVAFAALLGKNLNEDQVLPSSPPERCEIQQASWCLLYSDVTYEDKPSTLEKFASVWTIRGSTWKNYPLVVREPRGCRVGRSDTTEFIRSTKNMEFEGRRRDMFVVRMKKNKTCDLEFIYFPVKQDPQAGGFFAALGLLRPCRDNACEGEVIGVKIRPFVHP
jgi:hypothetical protein